MKIILLVLFVTTILSSDDNFNNIKESYFKSYDYEQMGKYSEAIKVLSPLYDKYPNGYTLNLRFGWLFYLNKNYNNSLKYYKKASLIKPYSIDTKLGLARVYLDTDSYEKAQNVCYELLKIDYYNYYANIYIVRALISEKKYDIALKVIEKMLSLYPTDVKFLEQLAKVYKATKSKYLQNVYQDILILDPNNVLAHTEMQK